MYTIKTIKARQILDSRGNPTLEVDIFTKNHYGRAAVPSGASTGKHEALELRDNEGPYLGKGVKKAIENIHKIIAPKLIGQSVLDQAKIDQIMIDLDGTENKAKLGANAILGVSLAIAHTAAKVLQIPLYKYLGGVSAHTLPVPMMNIINGGSHSDAPISFQEFMIIPVGAKNFSKALAMGVEIFHQLKKVLKDKKLSTAVGDEGGFAPHLESTEDAIENILLAIKQAGYKPKDEVMLALDCAASEFFVNEVYDYTKFEGPNAKKRNTKEQVDYLETLIEKYPIASIEDGMDENDWEGWKLLTQRIGNKVQLVGDDLFVTDEKRLVKGIKDQVANSILIKVNQIGTLTETIAAIHTAHKAGYTAIISHRSGETEDTTIADLAVGLNTGQIKTGSASRSDRMAKYNQLLRIEEDLENQANYPGFKAFQVKLS